ncbi:hypothetical protein OG225_12585 [Nocardia sp. NBC_01377]
MRPDLATATARIRGQRDLDQDTAGQQRQPGKPDHPRHDPASPTRHTHGRCHTDENGTGQKRDSHPPQTSGNEHRRTTSRQIRAR